MASQMGMSFDVASGTRACFFDLYGGAHRAAFSAKTPKAMLFFSRKHGVPIVTRAEDLAAFDVVFFSLHCFRDFYLLADVSHHKRKGQEWIAGGNAATNPRSVAWICDYVWVGSCEWSFPELLAGRRDFPCLYDSRRDNAVLYNDEDLTPEQMSESEIVMSKGCPRRCLFCIHPWRTAYAEQPKEIVLDYIRTRKKKGVGLVSNSSDDVSYYEEASELLDGLGKTDMIVSNSVQGLTPNVVAKRKREMLLGVEGMSARLRWVMNKPISRELYRDKVDLCIGNGKQIRTVYQFNLPGEEDSDWQEFLDDVAYFRRTHRAGSWAIPFIPNQPTALTPLQWVRPVYSWETFDRIQAFRASMYGSGKTGISIYAPAPLGGANWFTQQIAEWLPITPDVAKAARKVPMRLSVDEMVQFLDTKGVVLPRKFLDRESPDAFPWEVVKAKGDDADVRKRYLRMLAKMTEPPFTRGPAAAASAA